MRLRGYDAPLSNDASLVSLALTDSSNNAVTLSPAFDAATPNYSARVANGVTLLTVDAPAGHARAGIAFSLAGGIELTDADSFTGGFQISLAEGENRIFIDVTAEDGRIAETYRLAVTREIAPVTPSADAIELVSTLLPGSSTSASVGDQVRLAQRFTVRSDTDYSLEQVEVAVFGANDGIHAAIHESDQIGGESPARRLVFAGPDLDRGNRKRQLRRPRRRDPERGHQLLSGHHRPGCRTARDLRQTRRRPRTTRGRSAGAWRTHTSPASTWAGYSAPGYCNSSSGASPIAPPTPPGLPRIFAGEPIVGKTLSVAEGEWRDPEPDRKQGRRPAGPDQSRQRRHRIRLQFPVGFAWMTGTKPKSPTPLARPTR